MEDYKRAILNIISQTSAKVQGSDGLADDSRDAIGRLLKRTGTSVAEGFINMVVEQSKPGTEETRSERTEEVETQLSLQLADVESRSENSEPINSENASIPGPQSSTDGQGQREI